MSDQTNNSSEKNTSWLGGLALIDELPLARFDWSGQLLEATPSFNQLLTLVEGETASFLLPPAVLSQIKVKEKQAQTAWQTIPWPGRGGWAFMILAGGHERGSSLVTLLIPPQPSSQSLSADRLNDLPIGLAAFDNDGQVTVINQRLVELLGPEIQDQAEATSESFWAAVAQQTTAPEITGASLQQARAAPEENPQVELEITGEPTRYLQVSFFRSQGSGSGAVFIDNSEARDQVSWKLDLLSTLAHDLRTPLATLKGHATALTSNYKQWSQAMVLEFLQAMDQGVDDLVRQVDRSLALTRLESGRLGLQLESVSVQDLVQGALERAASGLGDSPVETSIPESLPEVRVDPARVEEVLANLLENAARFSPPEETIAIAVSHSEMTITLSVIDRGAGVPAERRNKIFEKYSQFPGDHEGKGLGLFISQQIVEAHGGRIWVESPPPGESKGSAFRFTIPLLPPAPKVKKPGSTGAVTSNLAGEQTILVVEQDIDFQSLLRAILEPAGFRVEIASGGPAALDFLTSHSPAAVILDLKLSRMDGISVCRSLRRRSSVPILLLVPQSGSDDLLVAIDAGADDYVVKPFQSTDLLARLKALLRRSERWRQPSPKRSLTFGELVIDESNRQVFLAGEPVHLTPIEHDLLSYLAHHQGQVLTHSQLIEALWPLGKGNRHALFVHINRLRGKIEPDPENPSYLVTRWGVGYTFLPKRRFS